MTATESAAAAVLGKGKNMKAKKPEALPKPPRGKQPKVDPAVELRHRAERWAALHANPKTRSKMDEVLTGLTPDDQRRVYLNGQRIAGGLPFKY